MQIDGRHLQCCETTWPHEKGVSWVKMGGQQMSAKRVAQRLLPRYCGRGTACGQRSLDRTTPHKGDTQSTMGGRCDLNLALNSWCVWIARPRLDHYRFFSMAAMVFHWLVLIDLSIFSTKLASFVIVCGNILSEAGIMLCFVVVEGNPASMLPMSASCRNCLSYKTMPGWCSVLSMLGRSCAFSLPWGSLS